MDKNTFYWLVCNLMKIIICICVFYCHFVNAGLCKTLFENLKNKRVVDVFPSALHNLNLPAELKIKLDQHPKVYLLRKKYNQGKNLKALFFIKDQLLEEYFGTGGFLLGEHIQIRFLMNVMRYIFRF